ncbi:MAG: hypothetical protein QXY40_04070 [Candidatus Methanomethylicia archaeon]
MNSLNLQSLNSIKNIYDWIVGVKRYFSKCLGLSIVQGLLAGFISIIMFMVIILPYLSDIITFYASLIYMIYVCLIAIIGLLIQVLFYTCFASIIIDGRDVSSSITVGFNVLVLSG